MGRTRLRRFIGILSPRRPGFEPRPFDVGFFSPPCDAGKGFSSSTSFSGTAVAQWLRCCATNRKVAGSIPAGVSGFFIDIKSFRSHYRFGVDSASNRNENQGYFLGVKAAGA